MGLKCQQKRSLLRDVQAVAVSVSFPVFRDYHLSLVQGAFTYLRWHWKVKSPVAHTASFVCVDYSKGPSRLVSPPHGQLMNGMNGLHSLRPLPPLPVPWDTFGEGGCSAHIINLFVFFPGLLSCLTLMYIVNPGTSAFQVTAGTGLMCLCPVWRYCCLPWRWMSGRACWDYAQAC